MNLFEFLGRVEQKSGVSLLDVTYLRSREYPEQIKAALASVPGSKSYEYPYEIRFKLNGREVGAASRTEEGLLTAVVDVLAGKKSSPGSLVSITTAFVMELLPNTQDHPSDRAA